MGPTVAAAARALARGGLVVYPTDTLLGLGAAATDRAAVGRLGRVKGRATGQAISVAVSSLEELETWAELSATSRGWARRHLPGPFTLLVRPTARARRAFPESVLPARGRLGLRVPDHPVARELARSSGPITATSANLHGRPPARTVADARRAFGRRVAVYLRAVPRPSGRPSTLVDLSGEGPLRIPRG
jgi:L-threonylcarbamoyladenylate synthase